MIRTAAILSTGDELTSGITVDTNSNWLADKLFLEGVELVAVLTVGDDRDRLKWAFQQGFEVADLVISTGGLGPTADDLTTEILAEILGVKLRFDEAEADHIRQIFATFNRVMPENNLRQAYFPQGSVIVPNPRGTAAGYRTKLERGGEERHVVVLPGVPNEMKPMIETTVLPWIRSLDPSGTVYRSRSYNTFGASESKLDELMVGVIDPNEAKLSFRAAFPQVSVRVTVRDQPEAADRRLDVLDQRVRERIGAFVFGEGAETMEGVVVAALQARGWKLALAESCTGGLVANRITNVAGSSKVFAASFVTYGDGAKERHLGVSPETIAEHGLVSNEVALEMAIGARRVTGADVAIGVTGVAGPDFGAEKKPVVCISIDAEGVRAARRYELFGNREWVKMVASQVALDWVRRHCGGIDPSQSFAFGR